jgi:putative N6-adenine-specific DNA methylase
MQLFATCARGIEPVLMREIGALGAAHVAPGRGGVAFAGDLKLVYRANLWLRTAIRILRPVLEAPVTTPEELYEVVGGIDWSEYMTPDHTLAVDCNVRDSHITHSHYAALKTKDAICDQFLDRHGCRPSVDVERPMVGLNLHIHRDRAILSLDSSGDSLHKRGYRPIQTRAPLNEALAAAIILLTGWEGSTPFIDPLCGSGTLPIEAGWIALRRPPGLTRKHFGFMGWLDYDVWLWTEVRNVARLQVGRELTAPVAGLDQRRDVIELARGNARAAGIGHLLRLEVKNLHDFQPLDRGPGTLVCNPPYGERIGAEKDLKGLYRALGTVLRERCPGWHAFVFSGNPNLAREIGVAPTSVTPLWNGKIPCRLLRFDPT